MSNCAVSQVQRDLEEQVVFNVPRTITGESDINIHYSLRHDGTPLDWIGIFHSSNTVTGQPLIFYWAPIKPSDPADPNSRTIIIPASHIQSLKSGVYTFVYMSQEKNVLGVSSEFTVQQDSLHTAEARECSPMTSDSWADSLVIMSSDEEWELASASLPTHEHSLLDLSDIVVLSTSPSKEAVKRNAQPMNNNILLLERLTENGISSQSDFKAATCVQEHAINESIIEHNDISETNLDPDQCGKDCTDLRKVKRKRNKPNKKCMSLSEELTNKHQAAHSEVVDTKVTKKLKKKKKKCGKFQLKTLNNELDVSIKLCDSSESPTLNSPSPKTSKNELHTTQVRVDECKSFIENSPHATISNNQKTESIKENTGKTKAVRSIKTRETKVSSAQTIEQQNNVTDTFQVPKDKNARKILHAKRRSTLIQTALKTCHVENINQQSGFSDKLYTTLPKGISPVVSEIYKSEFCDPMVKTEAVSILNENNKILKAKESKTELEPNNIECAGQQSEVLYMHSSSPKLITSVCKDESCWSNTEIKAIARVPRDNRKILKAKSKKNLSQMVLEPYKVECVNQSSASDEVKSCEPKRLLEAMPLFPKEKIEPTATDVKSTSVTYAHKIPKLTPVGVKVNHVFFPTLPHETDVHKNSNHLSQPTLQLNHSELRSVTEVKSNQNVELTSLQKNFATLNASLNLQTKVTEILLQTTKKSLDSEIAYLEDTSDLGFPLLPTRANKSAMSRKGRETTADNILESAESKTSCPNSMSDSTYTSTTSQPYQSVFQSLYKIKRKLIQEKAKHLRNRKVCQSDLYDCISSTMKRLQNGVGHTSTKSKSTLQPRPDGDENVFKLTQRECEGNILNTSLKDDFNKMIAYTKSKSVKNESLESEQISTTREGRQPTKTALSYASVVKMTKRNCTPSRDTDRLCRDTHKLNTVVTKTKANKSDKMLTPLCADENTGNQPITEEKIGLAKLRWPYPTPTPIHCAKNHRFKKAKAEHYFATKLASFKIKGNLMKTARIHSELMVLKRQIKNIFQEIESLRQQIYMYKILLHDDPRWRNEGYNAQLASSSSLPYETSTRTTCHTSPKEVMTSGYIYELDKVLRDVKTSELCDKCLYRTKAPPRCLCTKSYCTHTNRTDQVEDQMHQDFMNFENQMCTNNDTITKVYRGLNSTENETYNSINTTGNQMYSDLNNLGNEMYSKIKTSGNILYTCLNKKLNPLYNSVSLDNQLNNTGNYNNNIEKQMSVIDSYNQMPTYLKDAPNQSYSGGKGNQSSLDIKYGDYRATDITDSKLCVNSRDIPNYSITYNPLKQSAIYSQTNNLKNILTQCHDSPFCSPCCSSDSCLDNGLNNAKKTATHPISSHDTSVPLIQYMRQSVGFKHSETSGLDVQSNHVTTCRNQKPGTLNQSNIHDHCHQFHSGFMKELMNGDRKKIEFNSLRRVEGGQYYNPYLKLNKICSSPVNYNQSSVNDLKLGLPGSYIQTNKESSVTSSEKLNCCTVKTIPSFNWHIEALAAKKMTKF
ncbi:uncharacterized protein LOC106066635 isoform X1 [Biomphalaria glabrata]|uniref:Uncharacterized protein LOC106066635 isoform X1 n=2 Tax=Biomphalaria glabrata TaxID=6526 RepID=A0A9W3BQF3_BIOGL|nr:uncharacterized protein LOC106066635 isoform X1 [Biomphalaria glabrata]